ncbi:RNA-directed DNA polymerase [Abeliophyllum distichum]|uniref:RNA-directed DNA polymerase n=1 Tax=Abeliophyllum distichum TaxID=126358 RepID=A0ABD1PEQ2_9LAMI
MKLNADRFLSEAGAGAGILLISSDGYNLNCTLYLEFKASNNLAKYETLLESLRLSQEMKKAEDLLSHFEEFELLQILRIENGYANALSNLTSNRDSDLMKAIPVEKLS